MNEQTMSNEKQIKELRNCLWLNPYVRIGSHNADMLAQYLTNESYRKQSEGEWESNHQTDEYICGLCGAVAPVDCLKEDFYKSNFCPNCGAKMKGGAE